MCGTAPKPLTRPDLNKTHKTVREYDRPEYQQSNVSPEVEGKASAKHEQHKAGK